MATVSGSPAHPVLWTRQVAFRATAPGHQEASLTAAATATPPILSSYEVSFWAHGDRDQSIEIDYRTSGGSWQPYIIFTVPSGALLNRPDGTPIAPQDSIRITASIDTLQLQVRLEPSGLTFSNTTPALLQVWYSGANRDYDGNGVVDENDSYIESQLLGLWLQEGPAAPWVAIPSLNTTSGRFVIADIRHFSGYAVSW
jgi:hypothetical protein